MQSGAASPGTVTARPKSEGNFLEFPSKLLYRRCVSSNHVLVPIRLERPCNELCELRAGRALVGGAFYERAPRGWGAQKNDGCGMMSSAGNINWAFGDGGNVDDLWRWPGVMGTTLREGGPAFMMMSPEVYEDLSGQFA